MYHESHLTVNRCCGTALSTYRGLYNRCPYQKLIRSSHHTATRSKPLSLNLSEFVAA
jgi:hypothetical protein